MRAPLTERQMIRVSAQQTVSALWCRPPEPQASLVLAHGAGAGMEHASMQALGDGLAALNVATLRYQFPYMERGSRRPDPPPLCHATVRAAAAHARALLPDTPLFAGGRSFGGRMSSQARSMQPLEQVRGLVLFAFPLHPAGEPSVSRAAHLSKIGIPMLFLQGTADKLAQRELLSSVTGKLGVHATLHLIEAADHSFHVPARSGRTDAQVLEGVLKFCAQWMNSISP